MAKLLVKEPTPPIMDTLRDQFEELDTLATLTPRNRITDLGVPVRRTRRTCLRHLATEASR